MKKKIRYGEDVMKRKCIFLNHSNLYVISYHNPMCIKPRSYMAIKPWLFDLYVGPRININRQTLKGLYNFKSTFDGQIVTSPSLLTYTCDLTITLE